MSYGQQAGDSARLFVTKIPANVTREDVSAYFARFGVTTDVYLPSSPGTSNHKGIAFVSFSDSAALQLTMSHCPHEIAGFEVVVDVAAPRGQAPAGGGGGGGAPTQQGGYPDYSTGVPMQAPQQEESDRLFVTKVPPNLQKEHLREYFSQFGETTDVYVPSVPGSQNHKGIAFISFADPSSVRAALTRGQHEIYGSFVVVDKAAPRGAEKGGGKGDKGDRPPPQAYGGGGAAGGRGFSDTPPPIAQYAAAAQQQYMQQQQHQQPQYGQAPQYNGYQQQAPQPASQAPPPRPPSNAAALVPAGVQGPMGTQAPGVAVPGRLFVTRVTADMSRMDLQSYFQQFGELNDVFVPSGGKGIAFVSYRDGHVSQRVLEAHTHYVKPGQAVLVDQAVDRAPLGQERKGDGKGGGKNRPSPY